MEGQSGSHIDEVIEELGDATWHRAQEGPLGGRGNQGYLPLALHSMKPYRGLHCLHFWLQSDLCF